MNKIMLFDLKIYDYRSLNLTFEHQYSYKFPNGIKNSINEHSKKHIVIKPIKN